MVADWPRRAVGSLAGGGRQMLVEPVKAGVAKRVRGPLKWPFEINKKKFRHKLDMPRAVFGLPGKNKNESSYKTYCSNVLSDFR